MTDLQAPTHAQRQHFIGQFNPLCIILSGNE